MSRNRHIDNTIGVHDDRKMSLLCSLEMQGIGGVMYSHLNIFFLFALLNQKFCLIRVQPFVYVPIYCHEVR